MDELQINSWADTYYLAEEFNKDDNAFLRTVFAHLDADDHAYFGQLDRSKFKISPQEAQAALQPIADELIYPEFKPGLLVEAPEVDETVSRFIKRPPIGRFHDYQEGNAVHLIPDTLLREAYALQAFSYIDTRRVLGKGAPPHAHPSIVAFYGCRVRRGRITGLVLAAHGGGDLREVVRDGKTPVDADKIVAGLASALKYMHVHGWAHNDVNPANVMVSDDGQPVLVDFGSCCPIGDKMGASRGTPGFAEEETDSDGYTLSKASHDWYGLDKISEWLKNPTFRPPPY